LKGTKFFVRHFDSIPGVLGQPESDQSLSNLRPFRKNHFFTDRRIESGQLAWDDSIQSESGKPFVIDRT
jgi:hypothetical protein